MIKLLSAIVTVLILIGSSQNSTAQLSIGVGVAAQQVQLVDNEREDIFMDFGYSNGRYSDTKINLSPALNLEYIFSNNFFLSSSFSHLRSKSNSKIFWYPCDCLHDFPQSIHRFNALIGQLSAGYTYKSFGLELGVEAIQSLSNVRIDAPWRAFGTPPIFGDPVSIDPFLHFYPRLALSYRYGKMLGVVSGTFRQKDFLESNSSTSFNDRIANWSTYPNATLGLSIFYVWQASSASAPPNVRL